MTEGPIIEITKVSDKGQVVIPKEVRDKLKMGPGTKLMVVATQDAIILQKIETVAGKMRMKDILEIAHSITEKFKLGRG